MVDVSCTVVLVILDSVVFSSVGVAVSFVVLSDVAVVISVVVCVLFSVVLSLTVVVFAGLVTSEVIVVLVVDTASSLGLFSRAFGVGFAGNSGVEASGFLVGMGGSVVVAGVEASEVVGTGVSGEVGVGSLGVVGAGPLVVVGTGFLGVVGVGALVVVGADFGGVVGAVVVSASGVDLAEPSDVAVFSALRVSLPEMVFSVALAEVCLLVTEVSLVSTVVSFLAVEVVSLVVSELGGRLGLEFVVVTVVVVSEVVVTLLLWVVGLPGVGVSLASPVSCPLPSSSTTAGSGVGFFLGVCFLLLFTKEKNTSFIFFSLIVTKISFLLTSCVCL